MCQSHSFPVLRGLQIRIKWGVALGLFNEEARDSELCTLWEDAFAMGLYEYRAGIEHAPVLFADTSDLTKAWMEGQHFAWESEDMANCSGCQNAQGDPCPWHG